MSKVIIRTHSPKVTVHSQCGAEPERAVRSTRNISDGPIRAAVRTSEFVWPFKVASNLIHFAQAPIKALQKSLGRFREGFHKSKSPFVYGYKHSRKDQQGVAENLQGIAETRQGNE